MSFHVTDRLDKYFVKYMGDYAFVELMPEYIKKEHLDFMRNVPLPLKRDHVAALAADKGMEFKYFTQGMVNVIGMVPGFKYAPQYVNLLKFMNKDISSVMVMIGIEQAKTVDLELAGITLRAALVIDPDNVDALFNYMLVCRNLYLESEDNDYTADFKTEVFEALLALKEMAPELDKTYYYLGFAYINAGKYREAEAEWKRFVDISQPCRERVEIRDRLRDLEEPVRIEQGYNLVIGGQWEEGLKILEEFKNTSRMEWWPLPYYLGVGYSRTGRHEEALEMLKTALKGNPSSAEIMAELVIVNNALGDEVNAEKYRKKIELVKAPVSE